MSGIKDNQPEVSKALLHDVLLNARYAPSSHNTQPWTVAFDGAHLMVGYDPARELTIGDPHKRELFISLGCFIETISLAAKDHGLTVTSIYKGNSPKEVVELKFSRNSDKKSNWCDLIKKRRSDRRFYHTKRIPQVTLNSLESLSSSNAILRFYNEPSQISFLARMTHEATLAIMGTQEFRNELSSWVRNNWTKQHDGMPGYTQGMPGPISLIAKFVVKRAKKVVTDQAKKDSKRIQHSASLGIISIRSNTEESWIEAGRLYQKVCVYALSNDVKTSAVSAAVIFDKTTKEIKETLGITGFPVALMRFGYTKNNVKAAPRLSPNHFIIEIK